MPGQCVSMYVRCVYHPAFPNCLLPLRLPKSYFGGVGPASVPDSSRTFAEQLSRSLKLLGFVPMHSDSQQGLNVAS
jgi:hypothetical protein